MEDLREASSEDMALAEGLIPTLKEPLPADEPDNGVKEYSTKQRNRISQINQPCLPPGWAVCCIHKKGPGRQ